MNDIECFSAKNALALIENDLLGHRNFARTDVLESNTFSRNESKENPSAQEDVRRVAPTLALSREAHLHPDRQGLSTKILEHIDYVLVFNDSYKHSELTESASNEHRTNFEAKIENEGVTFLRKMKGDSTFVFMSCSFERLCKEAEILSLKMPWLG